MATCDEDGDGYQCKLGAEIQQNAEKELNEKAEFRTRDIQSLRERILANKGIKSFFFHLSFVTERQLAEVSLKSFPPVLGFEFQTSVL